MSAFILNGDMTEIYRLLDEIEEISKNGDEDNIIPEYIGKIKMILDGSYN